MAFFEYKDGRLHAESVPVEQIAREAGTPFYCYSTAAISDQYQRYSNCFPAPENMICYAVKANSNQAVIAKLAGMGAGADVVSEGELRRALLAGVGADKIVFSGVAKTAREMKYALEQRIFQFNMESEQELVMLSKVASETGSTANVAFRINPDVDAKTHAKISTGRFINKFGLSWKRARQVYAHARELPGIRVQGIAMHIGSQLTDLQPFERAFTRLAELAAMLKNDGHEISVLDIGGGLGIHYDADVPPPPSLTDYAEMTRSILGHLDCKIVVEPGRSLVGAAGVLVAKVIYVKQGETDKFLIIDAGMNDLLRPSFYDAYHEIIPVRSDRSGTARYQVVGPVCETADTFSRGCELPRFEAGDLLAILDAGAYGAVMSFSYNTRPLVPEILVDGTQFSVIRERPSYEELIGADMEALIHS